MGRAGLLKGELEIAGVVPIVGYSDNFVRIVLISFGNVKHFIKCFKIMKAYEKHEIVFFLFQKGLVCASIPELGILQHPHLLLQPIFFAGQEFLVVVDLFYYMRSTVLPLSYYGVFFLYCSCQNFEYVMRVRRVVVDWAPR